MQGTKAIQESIDKNKKLPERQVARIKWRLNCRTTDITRFTLAIRNQRITTPATKIEITRIDLITFRIAVKLPPDLRRPAVHACL